MTPANAISKEAILEHLYGRFKSDRKLLIKIDGGADLLTDLVDAQAIALQLIADALKTSVSERNKQRMKSTFFTAKSAASGRLAIETLRPEIWGDAITEEAH